MSKRRIITFATLFSVGIIVFLIGLTMVNFNIHSLIFMGKYSKVEKTFSNANDSKIVIDCEIDDIYIEQNDGDLIEFTYFTSDKIKYSLTNKNDIISLTMEDRKWSDYFEVNFEKKFVKLTLPENYVGELEVYNKKGKIKVDNLLNASKLFIRGEDSDVVLSNLQINSVSIENTGGDITINKLSSTNESSDYYFKTHAGDILINKLNSNLDGKSKFNVESTIGEIEFNETKIFKVNAISNEGTIKFTKLTSNDIYVKTGFAGTIVGEIDGDKQEYFIEIDGGINNNIVSSVGIKEETTLTKFLYCKVFANVKIDFTKHSSLE